jgi:hypothetical protein
MDRHSFFRLFAALILTGWGLAPASAQDGASMAAANPVIRSYGDNRSVNVADELASLRNSGSGLLGSVKLQPLTFAAAEARVNALAQSAGGEAAVAAVLAAVGPTDPEKLRAVAAREMVAGRPTGMFLVLWSVWQRFPADGDAWCDFAGVLAGQGYANEAAALLGEMKRRGLLPAPPLGIPGEEMRDYVEAYTQVRLGNKSGALAILRRVAGRTPMLAEAPRLLAAITDDEAEARKALLQSIWRKPTKVAVSSPLPEGEPEPDPYQAGEEVMADPRSIMDFSQAERGVLPAVPYAKSVPTANDLMDRLQNLETTLDQEFIATLEARKPPRGNRSAGDDVPETWGHRMYALLQSIDYRDAQLRKLTAAAWTAHTEREKLLREMESAREDEVTPAVNAWIKANKRPPTTDEIGAFERPYYEKYIAQARPACVREETAKRALFAEWHYLATAIAATVPEGEWHTAMAATIHARKVQYYGILVGIAQAHAAFGSNPLITKEAGEAGDTMPGRTQPGKCDGDKSVGFSTDELPGGRALPFELGFELTCEGASVEFGVDTKIPGVSFSTELGVDNKGSYTVFVGPKAELVAGDKSLANFNVSGKVGAYLQGNKNGMTDAGFKAEAKAGGGIGSVSGAQKLGEAKWSFVPSIPPGMNTDMEPIVLQPRR